MPEKFDSQKKIILFTVAVFMLASGWLFWTSDRYLSADTYQNWWTIYFAEAKGGKMDFIIENHGNKSNFHWEVLNDRRKQLEGDENVSKGEAKKVEIALADTSGKKISVQVSVDGNVQEIYKNLSK